MCEMLRDGMDELRALVIRQEIEMTTLTILGRVNRHLGMVYGAPLPYEVTELKRIAAEKERLEVQNRQLAKTESLGRMAGAVAHHFNNQLQAVMLGLELAKQQSARGWAPVPGLGAALQAARKAAEVSSSMLTYLGHTHGGHTPLDLAATCRQASAFLGLTLPAKARLEVEVTGV